MPVRKRIWKKLAIAASIVFVIGIATYTVISTRHEEKSPSTATTTHDVPAPNNTRAVITLADGSKVYLDSAGNGTIAQQNNVSVVKNNNGGIEYLSPAGGGDLSTSPNNKRPGVDYNTLSNPRGSKVISLTLSDGTKVWLNSESSLKYPIAFNNNTREVEITGEAYFEVKHNAKQPFKVHLPNGSVVEDIGTAFNVNAYTDEADIKTTLIEGSVRISNGSPDHQITGSQILKPGQQALVSNPVNPSIRLIRVQTNVDLDAVLAWKDGRFQFEGEDIESVMRQIARWYDVNIVYEAKPKDHFRGAIPRNVEASKVFQMLETMGVVKFEIKGKTVIVKSP
jgi:ferric-dicitrate binding protein FerR (iron transport regulator)